MTEITLGPGELLFHKGDIDANLYFVHKGYIELFLEGENKIKEIQLGNIGVKLFFN